MRFLIIFLMSLLPLSSYAVLIEVEDINYEVTTVTDEFFDVEAILKSQVWWHNEDLAVSFANAAELTGVYFAYDRSQAKDEPYVYAGALESKPLGITSKVDLLIDNTWTWGIATIVPDESAENVPEPGSLALLGLGLAGLGFSRRKVK